MKKQIILTKKGIFSKFEDKSTVADKIINLTSKLEENNYSTKNIYPIAHGAGLLWYYENNEYTHIDKKPVLYLSSVALETKEEEYSNYDFHRYYWIQKIKFPNKKFHSNYEKEKTWKHLSELKSPKNLAEEIMKSELIWRNPIWYKDCKYSINGANQLYGTSEYMRDYPEDQIEFAMSNEEYPVNGNCYVNDYDVIYFKLNFNNKRNLKLSVYPSEKVDEKIIKKIIQFKS